jgi:hypothetical protein
VKRAAYREPAQPGKLVSAALEVVDRVTGGLSPRHRISDGVRVPMPAKAVGVRKGPKNANSLGAVGTN